MIFDLDLYDGAPPERHSVHNRGLAEVGVLHLSEQIGKEGTTALTDLIIVRWRYIHHFTIETVCKDFWMRHDVAKGQTGLRSFFR